MNIDQALEAARAWIAADPDPETRRELQGHVDSRDDALLLEVMSGSLQKLRNWVQSDVGVGAMCR